MFIGDLGRGDDLRASVNHVLMVREPGPHAPERNGEDQSLNHRDILETKAGSLRSKAEIESECWWAAIPLRRTRTEGRRSSSQGLARAFFRRNGRQRSTGQGGPFHVEIVRSRTGYIHVLEFQPLEG